MPVTLVIGAQWGDEGKGRVVDFLAGSANVVARFGGGANAGHTVRVADETYKLRVVPSGAVAGVEHCIIGPGTVVSPAELMAELDALERAGIDVSRVWLSDLAHLIMPYHLALENAAEQERGDHPIGTTRKGIGPAYVDRVARCGLRVGDLRNLAACRVLLERRASALKKLEIEVDVDELIVEMRGYVKRILPHVCDTTALLHQQLRAGKRVLAEGAQGAMLDVGLGTYPYVTSSVTVAGGAGAGLGFGPREVQHVIGVMKAYATRVGAGPFPTELFDETGTQLRARGAEFGTGTGRPRRCGWLDLAALKYAVAVNGITHLALTKLDVLDEFDEVRICTSYEGEIGISLPFALEAGIQPMYETMRGWRTPSTSVRDWAALPAIARQYVERIEEALGIPISYISVGPERSQMIVRTGAPVASLTAAPA